MIPIETLRVALTKGRLEHKTLKLLEKAGVDCSDVRNPGRRLILPVPGAGLDVVLGKAPDVVTYVEHGVCHLGVVGKDTLLEYGNSYIEALDLGFGACRFSLAVREGEDFFGSYKTRRVATKYPNVARSYFDGKGMDVEIIRIEGSVELAPLLGLSDGIVDLVETGETLKANGLVPIADICQISARLIVNVAAMKVRGEEIDRFVDLMKGAM
jgi:ATP phosphoribosyltransferase